MKIKKFVSIIVIFVMISINSLCVLASENTTGTDCIEENCFAENATDADCIEENGFAGNTTGTDCIEENGFAGNTTGIDCIEANDSMDDTSEIIYTEEKKTDLPNLTGSVSANRGDIIAEDEDVYKSITGADDAILRLAGIDKENVAYTGKRVTFDIRVYRGNAMLRENSDYTLVYKNNIKACTDLSLSNAPCVQIKGRGKYRDISEIVKFKINPVDISEFYISEEVAKYSGKPIKPMPKVISKGRRLIKNRDYRIDYGNYPDGFIEKGNYEITITGINNYSGIKKSVFRVVDEGSLLSKATISNYSKSFTYTGNPLLQADYRVKMGKEDLLEGRDFTVQYYDNTEIGTACMVLNAIEGSGYYGQKQILFKVTGIPVTTLRYSYGKNYDYTGESIKPAVLISTKSGMILQNGKDYKISYAKNINAGNAAITISGIGLYSGSIRKTFRIKPIAISDKNYISFERGENITDNKGGLTPKVKVNFEGKYLKENKDYTVAYKNLNNYGKTNVNGKEPRVVITGRGNFNKRVIKVISEIPVIEPKSEEELVIDGPTIFVSPDGNDENAGDIEHPLKTVQSAIDRARPGETILLRAGKYVGNNVFSKSGEDGKLITVTSYNNERAIITTQEGVSGAAFEFRGNDYIKLSRLKISGLKAEDVYGILLNGGEEYDYIENCELTNIVTTKPGTAQNPGGSSNAILLYGENANASINHIFIKNNYVHDNVNGWSENISVAGNCEDIYVCNNVVCNNTNIGIDFYGNAGYCSNRLIDQPRNCECSGNTVFNCKSFYAENAGIYVDGAYNIKVFENEVYNNAYGIEIGSEEWRSFYDDNNLVRNVEVKNNNIHNNKECGLRIGGWSNDETTGVVKNCEISGNIMKNDGVTSDNSDGVEIVFSKCDNIVFNSNVFAKDTLTYDDLVYFDEEIDASKIINIWFDGVKIR